MLQNAFRSELQDMLNTAGMRNFYCNDSDSAPTYRCRRGTNLAKACLCNAAATATASAVAIMSCNAFAHERNSFGARVLNAGIAETFSAQCMLTFQSWSANSPEDRECKLTG